jgi:hypothetical protein
LAHYRRFADVLENTTEVHLRILPDTASNTSPPMVDQLAAIMPGDGSDLTNAHEIVVRQRDTPELKNISIFNAAYDPLVYVLLFPYGDNGYSIEFQREQNDNQTGMTMMKYYRYLLCERASNSYLFKAKKLFEQWIVDMYCKIKSQRLMFIRNNQEQLRSINHESDHILLPSSFVGGPRYMRENYQDCMEIVRQFGKPDLFITMTLGGDSQMS